MPSSRDVDAGDGRVRQLAVGAVARVRVTVLAGLFLVVPALATDRIIDVDRSRAEDDLVWVLESAKHRPSPIEREGPYKLVE